MTRIMHRAGIGVTHGAGDGRSEFPSDLADAGTAGSAAAFSVQTSDASALVTLASSIRGSDASALRMRVLVAVSAAVVADSGSWPIFMIGCGPVSRPQSDTSGGDAGWSNGPIAGQINRPKPTQCQSFHSNHASSFTAADRTRKYVHRQQ